MLEPTDLQGSIWDPRLNRGVSVLRVVSNVDPSVLNIAASDWRSLVRTACRLWEPAGVSAFVITFTPADTVADQVEGAVVIKLTESPDGTWAGYTNNSMEWKNNLTQSSLVWLDPDITKGTFQPGITPEGLVQHVLCHELGHVLGLAHRPDSVMATLGMTGKSLVPTAGDLARLAELYA